MTKIQFTNGGVKYTFEHGFRAGIDQREVKLDQSLWTSKAKKGQKKP